MGWGIGGWPLQLWAAIAKNLEGEKAMLIGDVSYYQIAYYSSLVKIWDISGLIATAGHLLLLVCEANCLLCELIYYWAGSNGTQVCVCYME